MSAQCKLLHFTHKSTHHHTLHIHILHTQTHKSINLTNQVQLATNQIKQTSHSHTHPHTHKYLTHKFTCTHTYHLPLIHQSHKYKFTTLLTSQHSASYHTSLTSLHTITHHIHSLHTTIKTC